MKVLTDRADGVTQDLLELSVTVEPTIDKTALWMTVRGGVPSGNCTQFLSLTEAKSLAHTLWQQAMRLERRAS